MRDASAGFTVIELLIVIAIIGILAAVLVPNLLYARTRAHDTAAAGCAKQIAAAQEVMFIDMQAYAADLASLDVATDHMTRNCESSWVDASAPFANGWAVSHPNGSGLTYSVGPGGIIPPP